MKLRANRLWIVVMLTLLFPSMALAHPGHSESSFTGGFMHPITGLDHLLAMITVGLLAFQRGGCAVWALPLAFLGMMTLGGVMSLQGLALPAVEFMIVLSVVVLGAMVALTRKVPVVASVLIVGAFAIFHGHAHLSEMGLNQSAMVYSMGFLLGTGLLHTAGVMGGAVALRKTVSSTGARWVRGAGVAVSALGGVMMVGWL